MGAHLEGSPGCWQHLEPCLGRLVWESQLDSQDFGTSENSKPQQDTGKSLKSSVTPEESEMQGSWVSLLSGVQPPHRSV